MIFKKRGFTYVELLVVMSITVILSGIIYVFQSDSMRKVGRGQKRFRLQGRARNIMDQIARDLRSSKSIIKFTKSSIAIKKFKAKDFSKLEYGIGEIDISGDSDIETVVYMLKDTGNGYELLRSVNNKNLKVLIKCESIDKNIFEAYTEKIGSKKDVKQYLFEKFIPSGIGDSGLDNIGLIRVSLKFKDSKDESFLKTEICLRSPHFRNKQKSWNFFTNP